MPGGGGPAGRGLTGSLLRQVRGTTPCWVPSMRLQRACVMLLAMMSYAISGREEKNVPIRRRTRGSGGQLDPS